MILRNENLHIYKEESRKDIAECLKFCFVGYK
jgi:hypothetical protein